VALAAGATPRMTLNVLESVQTMTAYVVQSSLDDAPSGTIEYRALFAVGLVLFFITLVLNLASQRMAARFRESHT